LALGSVYPLWESLTHFIESKSQVTSDWSSWGPAKSGWGLRYRRKGKALVALYPQKDRFMAQVVLGKAQAERAITLELGELITKILSESPQLRDGRWLSIPVLCQEHLDDLKQLLLVKMSFTRDV
jgi:hypothetical protein